MSDLEEIPLKAPAGCWALREGPGRRGCLPQPRLRSGEQSRSGDLTKSLGAKMHLVGLAGCGMGLLCFGQGWTEREAQAEVLNALSRILHVRNELCNHVKMCAVGMLLFFPSTSKMASPKEP